MKRLRKSAAADMKRAFALALVVTIGVLARDVARRATERSPRDLGAVMGWSLIAIMLLGPLLLPWYVTWALPLAWLLPCPSWLASAAVRRRACS